MTDIDPYDPLAPSLPGFEAGHPVSGRMVKAVQSTLAALAAQQLLEARHAGLCELALQLAVAVEAATASRRGTAVAMAARELREVLASLPEPVQGGDDEWTQFQRELAAAAERDTAVRDTP